MRSRLSHGSMAGAVVGVLCVLAAWGPGVANAQVDPPPTTTTVVDDSGAEVAVGEALVPPTAPPAPTTTAVDDDGVEVAVGPAPVLPTVPPTTQPALTRPVTTQPVTTQPVVTSAPEVASSPPMPQQAAVQPQGESVAAPTGVVRVAAPEVIKLSRLITSIDTIDLVLSAWN